MISFVSLTDHATGQAHHVSADHIVHVSDAEPAEVKLSTGEVLTVKETFRRIEALILRRLAKSETLLDRARRVQTNAASRRAGAVEEG